MKGLIMGAFLCLLTATTPEVNEFTYDEAQLMMKTAQAEAGNQGEDGLFFVLSCIVNRVRSEDFPNTVTEVITQEGQFSTVESGAIYKVELSPEVHIALARIEKGEVAEEIVAFENKRSSYLERYFSEAFTYRDHKFYTPKIH
jgi:N-acetylmuramoyl-L-alanine amidase